MWREQNCRSLRHARLTIVENSAGTSRHYGVGPLAFASTLDALREGGTRLHLDVKVGTVKSWASRAALLEPGFDALSVSITDG